MKSTKIFIASSSELQMERMEIVDLIQDLNDEFEIRDIKLKPVLWEYMDSSMGEKRKEDEYLDKLKECDICLVLFWNTLGEYTVEELDVAISEMKAGRHPRQVYVLFKESNNETSKELRLFKKTFSQKYVNIPNHSFDSNKTLREHITYILANIL